MSDLDQIREITGAIYEAGRDHNGWELVVRKISGTLNAMGGTIISVDRKRIRSDLRISTWNDSDYSREYLEYFFRISPIVPLTTNREHENTCLTDEVVESRSYERSEFYCDYHRRYGIRRVLSASLGGNAHQFNRAVFHAPPSREPFGRREIALLRAVQPLLRAFVEDHEQIARTKAAWKDLASRFPDGSGDVVVASNDGAILATYGNSDAILHEHDLIVGGDMLAPSLKAIIHRAIFSRGFGATKAGPYVAVAERCHARTEVIPDLEILTRIAGATALLYLRVEDPERDAADFRSLYSLTRAEARLAVILASGATPSEAARRLGVSPNTIKSQRRVIFEKVGVNRQAALAAIFRGN